LTALSPTGPIIITLEDSMNKQKTSKQNGRDLKGRALTPDMHIGIIGAGASGLTAADSLAQRGFHNVTILEKEAQVGGKCASVTVDGRVYELGAIFSSPCYTKTNALARAVGLRNEPEQLNRYYYADGRVANLYNWSDMPRLLWEIALKYGWRTLAQYRRIRQPGLDDIPAELCEDFAAFADRHGLQRMAEVVRPVVTGFGYGYANEIPAAYVVKYLDWLTLARCGLHLGTLGRWPEGIQTLWERLAAQHPVVLDVEIQRVERGATVAVETNRGQFDFDALLLTCPLDNALPFLDASPEERELFGRIRYYDYRVLLCAIDNLPSGSGFITDHLHPDKQGRLMIWNSRWPDRNIHTLYLLSDPQSDEAAMRTAVAADLRRFGADLQEVILARRWRYFPHVSPADMRAGFYPRLEALQGVNRTFYAGEIMSFASIECCARYAEALVDRFSAAVNGAT
jgi:predicted NAD/FAD-binding protein